MEPAQRSGIGRVSALLMLSLILLAPGGAALAGEQTRGIVARVEKPASSLKVAAGSSQAASPRERAQRGEAEAANGKLELEREALDNARLKREQELRRAREREAERARRNEEMLQRQRDAQKHSIERTLRYPDVRIPGDQDRDRGD